MLKSHFILQIFVIVFIFYFNGIYCKSNIRKIGKTFEKTTTLCFGILPNMYTNYSGRTDNYTLSLVLNESKGEVSCSFSIDAIETYQNQPYCCTGISSNTTTYTKGMYIKTTAVMPIYDYLYTYYYKSNGKSQVWRNLSRDKCLTKSETTREATFVTIQCPVL